MPAKLSPLPDKGHWVRARIAELAKRSENVALTRHARQRMTQRRIVLTQVLEVLRFGTVEEVAHQDTHGRWQCKLTRCVAGDLISVVCSVESREGKVVVVVTVIRA